MVSHLLNTEKVVGSNPTVYTFLFFTHHPEISIFDPKSVPEEIYMGGFRTLMAVMQTWCSGITFASHAKGHGFEPRRLYFLTFLIHPLLSYYFCFLEFWYIELFPSCFLVKFIFVWNLSYFSVF